MDKRAFIAVGLSIAVFYIFSMIFAPEKKPLEQTGKPVLASISGNGNVATQQTPPMQNQKPANEQTLPTTVFQKDIKVETDLYSAVFSSKGASLKSLTLKKYREEKSPSAKNVILGSDADPNVLTFSTRASGIALNEGAVFVPDAESLNVNDKGSKELTFSYVSGQGFTVKKTYTFTAGSYGINLSTQVINNSAAPISGSIQQVLTYPAEPKEKNNRYDTAGAYLFSDNSIHSNKIKDVAASSKRYEKDVMWSGFADKYFLRAIIAENNSIASVELKKNASGYFESIASSPQFIVNPGLSTTVKDTLFVGPKDIDILKAQGHSLVQSLDLGWFTVIAKPLLYSIKFFYSYVGNYGVAIIIITVILKALFFPLTNKSYKSMKGMQKIQPEMAKLREKYKDDRDTMNKEVMALYRDHKVNPMGGCLPMVVQIPVFFALYKSLMFSIELRHAPFFLWVTDLADKDPYYVTPVIMGITMFIQQKMTPSQMDPMQQKMMLALPVVFTFMFLSFPSGLVLYWLVNNVLTIAQQMYINRPVEE